MGENMEKLLDWLSDYAGRGQEPRSSGCLDEEVARHSLKKALDPANRALHLITMEVLSGIIPGTGHSGRCDPP
jgi:hypothetical protein